MTSDERRDVKLLDNSRRRRIARGSGHQPADVSNLVKGFDMIGQFGRAASDEGMLSRMQALASGRPGAMPSGGFNAKGSSKRMTGKPQYKKRKRR